LNPNENLWKYAVLPSGIKELWERTKDIWYAILPELVQRYTQSMPSGVELKKGCGHIIKK